MRLASVVVSGLVLVTALAACSASMPTSPTRNPNPIPVGGYPTRPQDPRFDLNIWEELIFLKLTFRLDCCRDISRVRTQVWDTIPSVYI